MMLLIPPSPELVAAQPPLQQAQVALELVLPAGNPLPQSDQPEATLSIGQRDPKLYPNKQNLGEEANIRFRLGNSLEALSQYSDAIRCYQQALPFLRHKFDGAGEAETLRRLGTAYWNLSEYQQSRTHLQQALRMFQQLGDRTGEIRVLIDLGLLYGFRWSMYENPVYNPQQAIHHLQQALSLLKTDSHLTAGTLQQQTNRAHALMNLGVVYIYRYDEQRAVDYLQQARAIFQQIGDRKGEARVLMNLGIVYALLQGDFPKTILHHEQNLLRLQQVGDRMGEALTHVYLSLNYEILGNLSQKQRHLEQALAIFQAVGNRHYEAIALNNLASVHLFFSNYQQAIDYAQQSLPLFQRVGDNSGRASSLVILGILHRLLGNYQQEIDYDYQALALAQKVGDSRGEVLALVNLGNAYQTLTRYQQAIFYHQQALSQPHNFFMQAHIMNCLGNDYWGLKDYQQAIQYHTKALALYREVGMREGEVRSLSYLGRDHHALQNDQQAMLHYQKALLLAQQIEYREFEYRILSDMGHLLVTKDQPELAIIFLKQSINLTESIRQNMKSLAPELQQSYTNKIATTYRTLADLLLKQDRIIEAQQVLDLLKVQELDDYLRNIRGNQKTAQGLDFSRPETEILHKYHVLQQTTIQLGQELTQLRAIPAANRTSTQQQRIHQLVSFETELNEQFNQFIDHPDIVHLVQQLSRTARRQNVNLEDLNALRDNLRQHQAVLLYPLILGDRLELILVTSDSPPLRHTVTIQREDLNRLIAEFRQAISDRTQRAESTAYRLYQYLIQPFATELQQTNVKTIIYAPDGALRYIPLAALYDGQQWLIQKYAINQITARSLTDFSSFPVNQQRVLAGAFVQGEYQFQVGQRQFTFIGLPFAGKEVDTLIATIPGIKLIDRSFNRETTLPKLNEYNIVHFATHAAFISGQPEDSFIVFGDGKTATLREIENWSLPNVDLVVLSACETGLGGLGNGEEILGLGYQFQRAGARAAIASLWQIDDGGTQALMSVFYAALKRGMTKAQALQVAQKALITGNYSSIGGNRSDVEIVDTRTGQSHTVSRHTLRHPYYWAPFILIGNGL